jgi:quinol monooxygenase YgiN
MSCNRRDIALLGAAAAASLAAGRAQAAHERREGREKGGSGYGIISQILAVPGKRDELAAILLEGSRDMAGCQAYLVAADASRADALWITEVWDSRESHTRAVASPAVQAAIARGGPLIGGFASHVETTPIGGILARR